MNNPKEIRRRINQVEPSPGDLIDVSGDDQITVTKPSGVIYVYPLDKKGNVQPNRSYVTNKPKVE